MTSSDRHDDATRMPYSGYARETTPIIDDYLVRVGRGTPGGEFHRRYWQAVAYEHELGNVPLRVRVLGEDLVVFRDRSGQIGCLLLNCCHRNASLEYGLIEERGLRCCYHGRVFDVDGTMLEIPGEPDRMKSTITQGAYPVRAWGGIVFAYMGPMDRLPFFPTYDFMTVPGVRIVPGERWDIECNWLQMRENTMDPAHTYTRSRIGAAWNTSRRRSANAPRPCSPRRRTASCTARRAAWATTSGRARRKRSVRT
jgi:nitrite reductase/ring-hydroxylating ferredoxin subunit